MVLLTIVSIFASTCLVYNSRVLRWRSAIRNPAGSDFDKLMPTAFFVTLAFASILAHFGWSYAIASFLSPWIIAFALLPKSEQEWIEKFPHWLNDDLESTIDEQMPVSWTTT